MRFLLLTLFCLASGSVFAAEKTCPLKTDRTQTNFVYWTKTAADEAMNTHDAVTKIAAAKKGMHWADECLKDFPDEVGCHFYRAVNQGLYLEAVPFGYQSKLKSMVADATAVIAHNPKYEAGGAYRMLGDIFLQIPSFKLSKEGLVKDVPKALEYAGKAIKVAPFDPENQFLMARIHFEREEWDSSHDYAMRAVANWQEKKSLTNYEKGLLAEAQKLLGKAQKKLTKG